MRPQMCGSRGNGHPGPAAHTDCDIQIRLSVCSPSGHLAGRGQEHHADQTQADSDHLGRGKIENTGEMLRNNRKTRQLHGAAAKATLPHLADGLLAQLLHTKRADLMSTRLEPDALLFRHICVADQALLGAKVLAAVALVHGRFAPCEGHAGLSCQAQAETSAEQLLGAWPGKPELAYMAACGAEINAMAQKVIGKVVPAIGAAQGSGENAALGFNKVLYAGALSWSLGWKCVCTCRQLLCTTAGHPNSCFAHQEEHVRCKSPSGARTQVMTSFMRHLVICVCMRC